MFKKKIFGLIILILPTIIMAAGIDNLKKYAGGEGTGGVNWKANGGNVDVQNTKLAGYLGSDNYGGINLAPSNAGVKNNGRGDLYGFAGGENLGGINFDAVKIDPTTGMFSGFAETENNGKINFDGENIAVKTYGTYAQEDNCKEHSVFGNAGSDGIGWISFDCKTAGSKIDYGVDVDRNGNLSGFAWSDAIGGISFDYYGGDDRARYNKYTKKLEGRVKALGGLQDPDDDGTGSILLNGQTDNGDYYAPEYNYSTYEFSKYAGGGDDQVIGGINFRNTDSNGNILGVVKMDPFYFRFYANKGERTDDPLSSGDSVVLSWETQDAISCTASEGGNTNGTDSNPKAVGEPSTATETISNLTNTTIFALTCKDSHNNSITKHVKINVKSPLPSIYMSVDDDNIPYNTSTNIHYQAKAVKNCRLTSSTGRDESIDSSDGQHTISTGNLTETTNGFSISCEAANQTDYPGKIVSSTIYVNVEKLVLEFYPETNPVRYRGQIKLFGRTEFANSCTASGDLSDFNGVKTTGETLKEGTRSTLEETEGVKYRVKMSCDGRENQKEEKEIGIQVGRNPIFGEI